MANWPLLDENVRLEQNKMNSKQEEIHITELHI